MHNCSDFQSTESQVNKKELLRKFIDSHQHRAFRRADALAYFDGLSVSSTMKKYSRQAYVDAILAVHATRVARGIYTAKIAKQTNSAKQIVTRANIPMSVTASRIAAINQIANSLEIIAKNLKAIVVKGTKGVIIYDKEAFFKAIDDLREARSGGLAAGGAGVSWFRGFEATQGS